MANAPQRDPRVRYEIWLSCVDCGDVVIPGENCELIQSAHEVTLAYPCVECGRRSASAVPESQLERLLAKGFVVADASPALELREPHPIAAPFTWDDLLAFHQLLESTAFVDRLLGH